MWLANITYGHNDQIHKETITADCLIEICNAVEYYSSECVIELHITKTGD